MSKREQITHEGETYILKKVYDIVLNDYNALRQTFDTFKNEDHGVRKYQAKCKEYDEMYAQKTRELEDRGIQLARERHIVDRLIEALPRDR